MAMPGLGGTAQRVDSREDARVIPAEAEVSFPGFSKIDTAFQEQCFPLPDHVRMNGVGDCDFLERFPAAEGF
jgi:hypothetical protein